MFAPLLAVIKRSVISAASTGTSHINDRLVLRAAGFYCSAASQGLSYRGESTTFITSHEPAPARPPVGVFRQVPGVKVTASDHMIDREIEGNVLERMGWASRRRSWQDTAVG